MKFGFIAVGLALAGMLAARPSAALTITGKGSPAVVGQAQSFQIVASAAVGTVKVRWNFGDGTVSDPAPASQVMHTYQSAGHYTVIVSATDDVGVTGTSFQETAYNQPTTIRPTNSSTMLLDDERHQIWNTNPDSDTVSVIDQTTLTRVHEFPVGHEPHSIAQAPDKTVWVTNQQSDEVVVLDRDTGAVQARIALPYASQPRAIAFGPTGMAYVSLFATGKLVEIDATSRKLGREVALGPTPFGVSVASDGRVFVTRFISPVDHGEVWVVSPQSFTLTNTIVLPFDMSEDTQSSGRGVLNDLFSMVISPDGTQAWVVTKKDDVARGLKRDGKPMTPDNFVRTALCKIDMKTEKEVVADRKDFDNRSLLVAVAFAARGDYFAVAAEGNNWVGVRDAYDLHEPAAIRDIGHGPDGLILTADGKLFVNASLSREVIVYDVSPSINSIDGVTPPQLAKIPTTDHDLLSAQLLLGKQIFYNSADTRMGQPGYWSCASCHFGGISDGRVWDFSDRGEGLRNTKTLLGIRGGKGEGRLHWSANMDEIQDFEREIRHDFRGTGFMSDADFAAHLLPDGTFDTLGKPSAGVSPELDALAAYITSLAQVQRSPFRNSDGSFTKDALAGRTLFANAGCPVCHKGPDFTDSPEGLLHDVGTLLPTSGERLGKPLTGLDTPTLKGVWQSPPYFHDGRAATLAEVLTKYNVGDKMGMTSNLSPTEINQLVEYLLELDDVPENTASEDMSGAGGTTGSGGGASMAGTSMGGAVAGRPTADSPASACAVRVGSSRSTPFAAWLIGCCALAVLRRRSQRAARPS